MVVKNMNKTLLKLRKPYLYGTHAVQAALGNPLRRPGKLYMTAEVLKSFAPAIPYQQVGREELSNALGEGAVHQGILLEVSDLPIAHLEDVLEAAPSVCQVLILDQICDPHNVGAIARSAAAFGVHAIVQQDKNAPDTGSAVIAKVACGAIEHIPFVTVANLSRAIQILQKNGFWVIGLDEAGETSLDAMKLSGRTAFVMGREGEGLRRLVRENCDELARLPTNPAFPTLNVSNAAAITLYEWARQNTEARA